MYPRLGRHKDMRNLLIASRQDEEQQLEAELCTTLSIAFADSDRPLTQDEVDLLLGVRPPSFA